MKYILAGVAGHRPKKNREKKEKKKKKKQKQNERAKKCLRAAKSEVCWRGFWGFVWGALILFDLEHRLDLFIYFLIPYIVGCLLLFFFFFFLFLKF